jgi:hypothetical protein
MCLRGEACRRMGVSAWRTSKKCHCLHEMNEERRTLGPQRGSDAAF